jgi:hypothetical protein
MAHTTIEEPVLFVFWRSNSWAINVRRKQREQNQTKRKRKYKL